MIFDTTEHERSTEGYRCEINEEEEVEEVEDEVLFTSNRGNTRNTPEIPYVHSDEDLIMMDK